MQNVTNRFFDICIIMVVMTSAVVVLFFVITVIAYVTLWSGFNYLRFAKKVGTLPPFLWVFGIMHSWGMALATHAQCRFLTFRCSSSYISPIQRHKMPQNGIWQNTIHNNLLATMSGLYTRQTLVDHRSGEKKGVREVENQFKNTTEKAYRSSMNEREENWY